MIGRDTIKALIKHRNQAAASLAASEHTTKRPKREPSLTALLDKCNTKEEVEVLMKERGLL